MHWSGLVPSANGCTWRNEWERSCITFVFCGTCDRINPFVPRLCRCTDSRDIPADSCCTPVRNGRCRCMATYRAWSRLRVCRRSVSFVYRSVRAFPGWSNADGSRRPGGIPGVRWCLYLCWRCLRQTNGNAGNGWHSRSQSVPTWTSTLATSYFLSGQHWFGRSVCHVPAFWLWCRCFSVTPSTGLLQWPLLLFVQMYL